MDMFENGQSPDNINNKPEQPVSPDLNREGGVFAEQDFSKGSSSEEYPPCQAQEASNGGAYRSPADNLYRQMYSAQNTAPVNDASDAEQGGEVGASAENAPPRTGYAPASGYYYQPQVGAVPATAPPSEMKKSSKGWIIAVIIIVILMFSAVMLLLAFGHENDGMDNGQGGMVSANEISNSAASGNVTVNINVVPKPVEDDGLYQNRETGLLTPAGAAKQALPSVVSLYSYSTTTLVPSAEASGVIISEDGYIITNAHAVEDASRFKVRLSDEREFEAKLIGADTNTDLAVLKIEAEDLTSAVIGGSSQMLQGEDIVCIGNGGGFNDTVTVGHVAYVDREITSYTGYPIKCIQTDAVLHSGNSGGAMVNLYGQVVGIVVSKYNQEGGENICFAISSDFAVPIVEDIIEKGYVSGRARIGIIYKFISPENAEKLGIKPGLLVAEIAEDCDVANTELQAEDIITEIDGIQMITEGSIKEFQNTHKAGDIVTAKVYRVEFEGGEREFEITFRLEEMT